MLPWYRQHPKVWFHLVKRDSAFEQFCKCSLMFFVGILILKRLGRGLPSLKLVETYLMPKKG